jgi:hypothetical protein
MEKLFIIYIGITELTKHDQGEMANFFFFFF